jgi:hypothetical protein
MRSNNPTATLRPTRFANEAAGDFAIDTIAGLSLTLRLNSGVAELIVRSGERRIGTGELAWQGGDRWQGGLTIYGVPWAVEAIHDSTPEQWRVTLIIPTSAHA